MIVVQAEMELDGAFRRVVNVSRHAGWVHTDRRAQGQEAGCLIGKAATPAETERRDSGMSLAQVFKAGVNVQHGCVQGALICQVPADNWLVIGNNRFRLYPVEQGWGDDLEALTSPIVAHAGQVGRQPEDFLQYDQTAHRFVSGWRCPQDVKLATNP